MANIEKIKEFLNNINKNLVTSLLIDEFGYSIAQINDITDNTLETDDVIIAYSVDVIEDKVVGATHYITLAELEGADTVVFGRDEVIGVFN